MAVPTGVLSFNPATDIPSLEGKIILITGANSGLGKQSALELAKHSAAQIWMAARNAEKGQAAVTEVQKHASGGVSVRFLHLDLASFASIRSAARQFLASADKLDILMLNAGILGCPPGLTADGYDIQMGTNHLGHALLLKLLTPVVLRTAASTSASTPPSADVRVVSLSSVGYKWCPPGRIPLSTLRDAGAEGATPVSRYTQSKLANLLYAQEFARHYPQLTAISVDPGTVDTELFRREPGDEQVRHLQTVVAPQRSGPVEEGVRNQLWAAAARDGVVSGRFYDPVGVDAPEGQALDVEMAGRLWEWTQGELEGQDI